MGSPAGVLVAADAAAWIRTIVLPAAYLASTYPSSDPSICPCQYGPSGHCNAGRCEKCPRTYGSDRHGQPWPDTRIIGRDWKVCGHPDVVAVWRTGPACRWLCPHPCHTTVAGLFEASTPVAGRASRTGGNQISATDRLRRFDADGQLDLFGGPP